MTRRMVWILVLAMIFVSPLAAFAANGDGRPSVTQLVPGGPEGCDGSEGNEGPCNFQNFLELVGNVFNFIVFYLAVPAAAISLAYAGILFVIYPTQSGKREEAKEIIKYAVWGLVIALGGYLIVTSIVESLTGANAPTFLRFLGK